MCAMRVMSNSTSTFHVNSHADSGSSTPILSYRPPTSSPLHIVPTANVIPLSSLNMKDTSTSSRHSRNNPLYPRRRPSPHGGVIKSRKSQSPLTLSVVAAAAASRRSPRVAKMESVLQRRRELQLAALRREGILSEDEYREEIRFYMYEMEVRWPCLEFLFYISHQLILFFSEVHNGDDFINGPATRNQMAHAPLPRRVSRRTPLHLPLAPRDTIFDLEHCRPLCFPPNRVHQALSTCRMRRFMDCRQIRRYQG